MTKQEIIEELKQLPLFERLSVIEITTRMVREELKMRMLQTDIGKRRQLAEAAEALLADYTTDSELTAFTALDSEDFYDAER